ncbi:hypothetical protein ABZ208_11685 [Streptomyces sp. NPDC006208]
MPRVRQQKETTRRTWSSEALLVVEITSKSNAKDDRTKKLWAYAHAPVPT